MPISITYSQFGVTYSDPCYTYAGANVCEPSITRPGYWIGWGGRPEERKRKRAEYLAVAVQAKCLSVNGTDISFICDKPSFIRFSGELEDVKVAAKPLGDFLSAVHERPQVRAGEVLGDLSFAPLVAAEAIPGDDTPVAIEASANSIEPSIPEVYGDIEEEEKDPVVSGGIYEDMEIKVAANPIVLEESTKRKNEPIITVKVLKDD